ncbi:MAG: leucyl aminopeptidase [Alphaproteobacteria bacterium]|nr:leucyl aminopeptidase [Alphaproteobacteria bacterium]
MQISFANYDVSVKDAVVVGIWEGKELSQAAKEIDDATSGAISRALDASVNYKAKVEEVLPIVAPHGVDVSSVMCVGLGKKGELDALKIQKAGGVALASLYRIGAVDAYINVNGITCDGMDDDTIAANMALGAKLRSYRFDKYRTKEKNKPKLKNLNMMSSDGAKAEEINKPMHAVSEGVFLTRDLVSEPANVLYPETFVGITEELKALGVEVEVLDLEQMQELGMGMLIGVAQGSVREPKMAIMRWNGAADKDAAPVSFVGKGVTFDTGGISIKPAKGMEEMKYDMGGAAVVTGLMKALALRKANVNAIGAIGLVENMPSANAQRPGDVVTSMSGQTVEVLNTDAEGRLVLGDVMWYVQENYNPSVMIDLATLTGAIVVALGEENAGMYSNDDALAKNLTSAGLTVDEHVWRMPLGEAYDKLLKSDIADMQNTGGRDAGSITAAQFLRRFVKKDQFWAHLDIAGTTWKKKDTAVIPKGGTGFGVRLLDKLVADHYEG